MNDAHSYVTGELEGLGLIQPGRFLALLHIKSGRLVEVLSDWTPSPMPISVIYPHSRHLAPAVRAFVDWTADLFATSELFSEGDGTSGLKADLRHHTPADPDVPSGPIQPID